MTEWDQVDRVLPCLLDRLTDKKKADDSSQANSPFRVGGITVREFRQAVLRDLRWLFNTPKHVSGEMIYEFPEVADSVINFGTRDITGACLANVEERALEQELRKSILRFEPRIKPGSLSIKATKVKDNYSNSGNKIVFELRGFLDIPPVPDEISAKTEIDLDTGHFETMLL
jgi:type VI secretion system protein ImpF